MNAAAPASAKPKKSKTIYIVIAAILLLSA